MEGRVGTYQTGMIHGGGPGADVSVAYTLELTLVRCDTNGRCEVGSSTARLADDESYRSMERV